MKTFQEYLDSCNKMTTFSEAFRTQGDAFTDFLIDNLTLEEFRAIYSLCERRMNRCYQ